MNFFILSCFLTSALSLVIGFFIYSRNKEALLNKLWMGMSLSVCSWSFGLLKVISEQNPKIAFFWQCFLDISAVFIPVLFFHFILVFLEIDQRIKYKIQLALIYLLGLLIILISPFPIFKKGVVPLFGFDFWINPGPFYFLLPLLFTGTIFYSVYLLIKGYLQSTGIKKTQIKFIIIAALVGFGGGLTNFFPQLIKIYPFGNFFVVFYLLFVGYAITKYHLFEIRVILTELLIALIAIILLIQALTASSLTLIIFGFVLLALFGIVAYFLIKSVLKEIALRAELEVAYQELQKLDQAKSEFVSIASHQLRTPLTAIKGYVSLLLEGSYGKLTDKNRPPIENIYQSGERLIRLINELLNISRIEAGKLEMNFEETPIEEVINLATEETKMQAEKKKLYLKLEKPEASLPKVFIDKDKIKQVIMNVVDNAIKYTSQGGVTIKAKSNDSKVIIEVSDTGDGMAEEEISKLFKSFSRGSAGNKLSTEGAGLGLHIAKRFIEFHGGRIWAESPGKGKGSTVFIELPIKREK